MGAKDRMLALLMENVGKIVSRDDLSEVANAHDWQRSLRTLRGDGWDIKSEKEGYILTSEEKNLY